MSDLQSILLLVVGLFAIGMVWPAEYSVGMSTAGMFLVPVAGPTMEPITLAPKPGGQAIGRHEQCELKLPPNAEKVSRFHARFFGDEAGQWTVADLNSRWGTYLNGVKMEPGAAAPLREGDLIRISPWTFNFSAVAKRRGIMSSDEDGPTEVRSISAANDNLSLKDDLLKLLLETATNIHEAANENELADRVMAAAVRGTGLQNAIMLRPIDTAGKVEVIASQLSAHASQGGITFSRSLLRAAESGEVAEISQASMGDISQSVVSMKINAALCVPIMLGATPAQYLYLDSRGGMPKALQDHARAFGVALGRLASLALSNLKRIDFEKRQAGIESDLRAAAAAQRWILPRRVSKVDAFTCLGESRPGQYVGGDFFDIIPLPGGKLAVALGDVSGKGVAASVLMTATQGYLHAALLAHGDPARAVTAVNLFVSPRRESSKFVTMWVGVFDPQGRKLVYVDAGHSYASMIDPDGAVTPLDKGLGMPVGVDDTQVYLAETVELPGKGRMMVVSDGIIEQPGLVEIDGALSSEQFQMEGVMKCLGNAARDHDTVAEVFTAVVQHAGSEHLADDATAVLVRW